MTNRKGRKKPWVSLGKFLTAAGAFASILGLYFTIRFNAELKTALTPVLQRIVASIKTEEPTTLNEKRRDTPKNRKDNHYGTTESPKANGNEKERRTRPEKTLKWIFRSDMKSGGTEIPTVDCTVEIDPTRKETLFKILTDAARYLDKREFVKSRSSLQSIINNYSKTKNGIPQEETNAIYVKACELMAVSFALEAEHYEKNGYFPIAEEKYSKAKEWYARTEREAKERAIRDIYEKARSLCSLCGIKAAEMKGADFLPRSSIETRTKEAEVYETNADDHVGTDVGMLSLRKSAEVYYEIHNWPEAARVYIKYTKSYPDASDLGEAYKKSAECYENAGEWERAVKILLEISDHPELKGKDVGRESLFKAAFVYEQKGFWITASDLYGRFLNQYPTSPMVSEAEYRKSLCERNIR